MEKFDLKALETAFNNSTQKTTFKSFIKEVKSLSKKPTNEKVLKKEKVVRVKKEYVNYFYPPLKEGYTVEEYIDELIETEEDGYHDLFSVGKVPDDGIKVKEFFMIGDRLFEVTVECDAEWVGDWSMRCNIPTNIRQTKIKEIKNFEVNKKTGDFKRK